MRKRILLIYIFFLIGCSISDRKPDPYEVPVRIVTIQVTVRSNDTSGACLERGGTWIRYENNDWIGSIGCDESKIESKK